MRRRKGRSEADIASRKSSKFRKLDGEFLEGTESSFDSVETMSNEGFNDAWNELSSNDESASLDAAIDVGQEDTLDDLDRSRVTRTLVGLAVLVAIGVGGFYAFQALTEEPIADLARASSDPDPNVLTSPIDERVYLPADGPVVVEVSTVLGDWFVDDDASGAPLPRSANALGVDSPEVASAAQGTTVAGTVFWGGRLHVALLSDRPLLTSPNECLVVAMAADDLSSLDVAGVGGCSDEFAATGDRVACSGANVVLMEMWPRNPDAVSEQRPVDSIRVRLEYVVGQDLVSQRGTIDLSGPGRDSISGASMLAGGPGDTIEIDIDGQTAMCELIDRAATEVRLLPG